MGLWEEKTLRGQVDLSGDGPTDSPPEGSSVGLRLSITGEIPGGFFDDDVVAVDFDDFDFLSFFDE